MKVCPKCHGTGLGKPFSDWYDPCEKCKGWRWVEETKGSKNDGTGGETNEM